MDEIKQKLVDKSIEAFILGLEIYNKPTIKYRIEGFSFFICNAWELMLKAELLNRNEDIYYSDKSGRTLSLEPTIKKICEYPSDDPIQQVDINNVNISSSIALSKDGAIYELQTK